MKCVVPTRSSKMEGPGTTAVAEGSECCRDAVARSTMQPSHARTAERASISGFDSCSAAGSNNERPAAEVVLEIEAMLTGMVHAALPVPPASTPDSFRNFGEMGKYVADVPADLIRTLLGHVRLPQREHPLGAGALMPQTTPSSPSHGAGTGLRLSSPCYFQGTVCDDVNTEDFRRRVLTLEQAAARARYRQQ